MDAAGRGDRDAGRFTGACRPGDRGPPAPRRGSPGRLGGGPGQCHRATAEQRGSCPSAGIEQVAHGLRPAGWLGVGAAEPGCDVDAPTSMTSPPLDIYMNVLGRSNSSRRQSGVGVVGVQVTCGRGAVGAFAEGAGTVSRRSFLASGVGLVAAGLVPGIARAKPIPVPANGFRTAALALPGVTSSQVDDGLSTYSQDFLNATVDVQRIHLQIFGVVRPVSAAEASQSVRDQLRSDDGPAVQVAVNLADLYVPGARFRGLGDNVEIRSGK